jgi:CheY-like chemotaxis protein
MRIFLIDDDAVDAKLVQRVLHHLPETHEFEAMQSADEALQELRQRGGASDGAAPAAALPELILLDLNMPGMSGLDFLREFGSDSRLRGIPVVVLTTSGLASDVQACFEQGVEGYFVKPLEYARFAELLGRIIEYWRLCETPQRSHTMSH